MKVVDGLLILNQGDRIIDWPDEDRSTEIQQSFLQRYNFPGTVDVTILCNISKHS